MQLSSFASPRAAIAAAIVVFGLLCAASVSEAFDPSVESDNFSKIEERQTIYNTPEYQALLRQVSLQNRAAATEMQASDPERNFSGHLCGTGEDGCAGDARLYDWETNGYGIVRKVLFTARSGATISGRVWATKAGPAERPGIVITNGSVQADEQLYWFVAQALAKAGYVVLTSDPQGQGQSDEQGESPDETEGSPAQTDGRPFYDGTIDALDFFLSTPEQPYEPVPSCNTGTSHAPKQDRRVAAGLNAAYNPFWQMLDSSRIGLAGHSFGASGVSYEGQKDPRVNVIVAWDNLGAPSVPTGGNTSVKPCPSDPAAHEPTTITKPALGMSADYGLTPQPNTSDPNPLGKSTQSRNYTQAGVDTGEIVIRGGTHYEFSWIPNDGFGGTLRGSDLVAWYTTAWFDKYLKHDPGADPRLLTDRWRSDAEEAAIDPNGDGNMYSFYYRSRIDIDLADGTHVRCENLRDLQDSDPQENCGDVAVSDDGRPASYSYLAEDTSPDADGYPRPQGATPLRVALAIAYKPCATPNRVHGAPLAVGSCSPPQRASDYLTVGTLDSNGKPAQSVGSVRLTVAPGDLRLQASVTDVRRTSLADYGGALELATNVRITDRNNAGAPGSNAATAIDTPFSASVPCTNMPESVGSTCSLDTTANSIVPGVIVAGNRSNWQLETIKVFDGGRDGDPSTTPNTLFADQGIFVP
jgi:dienelactone hydrolase